MKDGMKPSILAMALLATAAGGCESEKKPTAETPEYGTWRRSRISIPAAHYAPKVSASLEVFPARDRVKNPEDFCEIFINGDLIRRFRTAKLPDGSWPVGLLDKITLRTGANWIDMWDSSSNKHYRHTIDTRQGTIFVFTPTDNGYDLTWSVAE